MSVRKAIRHSVDTGYFPFNKNHGLKFWKFHSQWNGTFRLHRPDPSHRAFGYCSCKQDKKERLWEQQICQMERDISVRPTGPPSKLVPNIPASHLMYQPKFSEVWVEWKVPIDFVRQIERKDKNCHRLQ